VLHAEHPDRFIPTDPEGVALEESVIDPEGAGSVGLLFAATCIAEKVENARLYPQCVAVDGFLEVFLQNATSVRCLDLRGSAMDASLLQLLPLAHWLVNINLSNCGIDGELVTDLVEMMNRMPCLQVIDLSYNKLEGDDALDFVKMVTAWRRIDVSVIRLDGNPLGEDEDAVREGIEEFLEHRGRRVIRSGDLVSHVKGGEVKWRKQPTPGTMRACPLENRNEPTIMNISEMAACVDRLQENNRAFKESGASSATAAHEKYLRERRMIARLKQHPALLLYGEAADSDED